MIARRTLLGAGAAIALLPKAHAAGASRLSFLGSTEQGGLVIGQAPPGSTILIDDVAVLVSLEGIFAFGIPYDAVKPVRVAAKFTDGSSESATVVGQIRHYDIQAINGLPPEYVEPPPEITERIAREREQVWNARKRVTGGTDFTKPLEWPFAGTVSSHYGNQRVLNGKPMAPHLGVDVAAPVGTPIHAAADGIVSISDDFYIEGGLTLLDHGHGVSTCYLHQSARKVVAGDKVARGQVIGMVGKTGRATGPHCHWGLAWFQLKLDPSRSTPTPEPPAT